MKNQQQLNNYFGKSWSGRIDQYKYSGPALIDKIAAGESVIDIGCGTNYFKGKIPNLLGIDPAFDQADIKVSIEDFLTDKVFDVAFCLGSINFGEVSDIEKQIVKISSLLKPKARIYWRCNPGKNDHPSSECKDFVFFPWSEDWHKHFAALVGFNVDFITWDENATNPTQRRLYAEWSRG